MALMWWGASSGGRVPARRRSACMGISALHHITKRLCCHVDVSQQALKTVLCIASYNTFFSQAVCLCRTIIAGKRTADTAVVPFEHTGSISCGCLKDNAGEKRSGSIAFEQWQVSTCAGTEVSP